MAKEKPTQIDRFRIICETDTDEDMGRVVGMLTRMGFKNVGFELITDVLTYKQRGAPYGISAEEFALAWLADHPTFALGELTAAFKAGGRTPSAAYYAVKKLLDARKLRKLEGNNYQRADVAAIEAPPNDKPAPKKFDTRGEDEILQFARKHGGKFNTAQLVSLFADQGRSRNSIYASCNTLMNEKKIKRIGASGSGDYLLLAKAKKQKKSAPKKAAPQKPAPHLNGGSQEAGVTHG